MRYLIKIRRNISVFLKIDQNLDCRRDFDGISAVFYRIIMGSMVALQLAERTVTVRSPRRISAVLQLYPQGGEYTLFTGGVEMARKAGSLGGEMRMRISSHCEKKSNKTRWNYIKACGNFDKWRKSVGISNRIVREDSKAAIEKWRDALQSEGYAASTIHTYIAGVYCGLGIDMTGIVFHGTSEDKSKSLGRSERSRAAREKLSNERIVIQEMVGARRGALGRLTGADLVVD